MCDAHLVVAKTPDGSPSCFYVPRWRPDGTKNAVQIQRLKDKVGNRSNSSSEVEFHDAWGILIGEAGRGIPTIIEMASYTRLSSIMSSASFLRQALVQAIAYTRQRKAFGSVLAEQPLMRAVLMDMALESEAALVLMMRLAQAFERGDSPLNRAWLRVATPAAKFWVCKRAVEIAGEAMEVFGGNGYVEEGPMARLFREAPVNSIWEGSGNVMCLDVMRALARDPQSVQLLIDDAVEMARGDAAVKACAATLRKMIDTPLEELEALGRVLVQRLVLLLQAGLLCQRAPGHVAEAFIQTRLVQSDAGRVSGAIDIRRLDVAAMLERAFPR
jgi:putative acyl-CoA dehydrogenase